MAKPPITSSPNWKATVYSIEGAILAIAFTLRFWNLSLFSNIHLSLCLEPIGILLGAIGVFAFRRTRVLRSKAILLYIRPLVLLTYGFFNITFLNSHLPHDDFLIFTFGAILLVGVLDILVNSAKFLVWFNYYKLRILIISSIILCLLAFLVVIIHFLTSDVDQNSYHYPTYILFGLMSTISVIFSILVYLTIRKKEAQSLGQYLDIVNHILDEIRPGEEFHIIMPAHNPGQRDAELSGRLLGRFIKQKYALYTNLLKEKSFEAKGNLSLLSYTDVELSTFTDVQHIATRADSIHNYNHHNNSHSPLFRFLMNFAEGLEEDKKFSIKRKDDIVNVKSGYMQDAFEFLAELINTQLAIQKIIDQRYAEVPVIIIHTPSKGYLGLYKMRENMTDAEIRGIELSDKKSLEMLKYLYDTINDSLTKPKTP